MKDLRVGVVVPMVSEASILFETREFAARRMIGIWEVHERREELGPAPQAEKSASHDLSVSAAITIGVVIGGIGMVNSAMATSNLIQHWEPDIVALVGCAGAISPKLLPGDVAIGRDLCYYSSYLTLPDGSVNLDIPGIRLRTDYSLSADRTSFATEGQKLRYLHSDPTLVDIALRAGSSEKLWGEAIALSRWPDTSGWPSPFRGPICASAVIGTADQINSNAEAIRVIRERFGVEVEDCESTAAAHAALSHRVPFIAIRGISDNEMINPAYGEFLRSGKGNLGWVEKESTRNAWAVFLRMLPMLPARFSERVARLTLS